MKKIILLLILLALKFAPAEAQWVTIPNANMVAKLTLLYPSCMNGNQLDTTCTQIVNEDSLSISYLPISDFTGIQYFDSLKYLRCYNTSATFLPQLPNTLKYLDCSNNPLPNLPNLPNSLIRLICDFNQLTSLPALPGSLEELSTNGNNLITSLPVLPTSLTNLSCNSNALTSLPALPNYLDSLVCPNNDLTSLPPLPGTLKTLNCGGNQIINLPVLPNTLQNLICHTNQITSLPITLPDSLNVLDCSYNPLTSLPQLPLSLKDLICDYSQITSLPPLPASLLLLSCGLGQLTSLPVLPGSLITLRCSQSNLTSGLPALPNTLEVLYCASCQLTNLPVLPNSLKSLICNLNPLSSLPSLPSGLETLQCYNCQLTSLPPLPGTIAMLECTNNQLTTIPPLPYSMQYFKIQNNNILCMDRLPLITGSSSNGNISGNPLTCVPNQTNYSLGLPLCLDNDPLNNPNNCISTVNIGGYVYTDQDSDCDYGVSDLGSANIPVKLYDSLNNLVSQYYTSGGTYGFAVNQPGTYKVKLPNNTLPIAFGCSQADSIMVNLISVNNAITNNNFPIYCNEGFDANVQSAISQGWNFPGQIHTLQTNISNNEAWYHINCDSLNYSGTVTIQVAGPVTYVSPMPDALIPQVNGNTFTYNITDFNTLTPASFGLRLMTDTFAQMGSQICAHIAISTAPLDADSANNNYDYCYHVVNSYDPNMKEVYPENVLPGYDDWFTYTIHFQNTGNAPAFNIRLRDTLDTQLDLNTFEVLGYSHTANTTLSGNILTVRFNNIMLPDSTTDYEGSMGYFQYRIKPLANLPNGSQIENTAYIYFDYNAPIVTNTTLNNFDITVPVANLISTENGYILYPNPSSGIFTFRESKNIKTIEVYNLMGELVLSQGNAKQINLQGFPQGIYVAKINGQFVNKLVKE